MSTAVVFAVAKKKKKPTCPSTIKWKDFDIWLHNRFLQSNDSEPTTTTHSNMDKFYNIALIERRYTQKSNYYRNLFLKHYYNRPNHHGGSHDSDFGTGSDQEGAKGTFGILVMICFLIQGQGLIHRCIHFENLLGVYS